MKVEQLLRNFMDENQKLKAFPTKRKLQNYSLHYLASKFEKDKLYTEKEVNELLNQWHTFQDSALLRRELFDSGYLNRESNGSQYWMEEEQPKFPELEEVTTSKQESSER